VAANRQLRADLLKKLGVGERRLQQRVAARARELPSTHEEAMHTLAYESGLKLSKYLSPEETAQVRALISQSRTAPQAAPAARNSARGKRPAPRPVLVTIAGISVEKLPGMTATHAKEAEAMATKVYPALYVFENSARDLISRVLKAGVGDDWWDKVVPQKVKDNAAQRKKDEAKDPWHGKRGAALIDYLDLTDLPSIVGAPKAWPHLKPFFDRPSWFQELVNELNVSRRVAAHMNPLEPDDIKNVEAAFRKWGKVLKAKEGLIP
jgi:hypothetical protein